MFSTAPEPCPPRAEESACAEEAFPPAKLGNLEKRRARHFLKLQIQAKKIDIENDSNGDFTPIKKLWVEIFLPVRFPKTPRRQLQH